MDFGLGLSAPQWAYGLKGKGMEDRIVYSHDKRLCPHVFMRIVILTSMFEHRPSKA